MSFDYQTVDLIAKTESLLIDQTIEDFVAYVARVSNPSNQLNTLTYPKLIAYLTKHRHWSPFEMANMVLEINTTRDIGRQILRHRSFTFQEFSQRYADPTSDLGLVIRECRMQDDKNRQASLETDDVELKAEWDKDLKKVANQAIKLYRKYQERGVAKEQLRCILPEGLTMSRMYMSGSVRSWIHYCIPRMEAGTQKEHRDIATKAWAHVIDQFPSFTKLKV